MTPQTPQEDYAVQCGASERVTLRVHVPQQIIALPMTDHPEIVHMDKVTTE